jgi:hypothetical protein
VASAPQPVTTMAVHEAKNRARISDFMTIRRSPPPRGSRHALGAPRAIHGEALTVAGG